MPTEQIIIGTLVAILCLAGLWNARWFVADTKHGQALVHWCGETKALWILRASFAAGAVFGVLLATGILDPVQW